MPALTILAEVDFDIAARCTRNTQGTGMILIARNHDWRQFNLIQK